MIERKKTDKLVVHCADTPEDMDIGAEKIREWHTKERGWDDIGYHWVIKRDGTLEAGRAINMQGAHAKAVNGSSIGCCLVGRGDNFTDDQYYNTNRTPPYDNGKKAGLLGWGYRKKVEKMLKKVIKVLDNTL